MARTKIPLQTRFLSRIQVDQKTGCWLWQGSHRAYGFMQVDGKDRLAHRIAWELYRGPIPAGLQVCHKCDVRLCANPYHLFLGTALDNTRDKIRKGRGPKSRKGFPPGVIYDKRCTRKPYRVHSSPWGQRQPVGSFATLEEAAVALKRFNRSFPVRAFKKP